MSLCGDSIIAAQVNTGLATMLYQRDSPSHYATPASLFKAFGRKLGVDLVAVAVRPYRLFSPSLNHLQRIRAEIAFATE
jgi:hypothetical protein